MTDVMVDPQDPTLLPVDPPAPIEQVVTQPAQADYFGDDGTYQVFLPDGISYIEMQFMNEAGRRKYQAAVSKDVRVAKASGDAYLRLQTGEERKALIMAAAVGWNLQHKGKPVTFSNDSPGSTLAQWVDKARPQIIDVVEKGIRKEEPWILGDVTVEDIDKQMEELIDLRKSIVERDEGKDS